MSKTMEYGDIEVPAKWAICFACNGDGTRDAWDGGMTASEWNERLHDDPDFGDDYRSGMYDKACEDCKGSGKVLEVDMDRCNPEQVEYVKKYALMLAEDAAIEAAERRAFGY